MEKAEDLLPRCDNMKLTPGGTVHCFSLVERDVRKGVDGYTGKKLQESPISIFEHEVKCFAKCYRGDDFANQVQDFYKKMDELR